jgi:hypothetical protein
LIKCQEWMWVRSKKFTTSWKAFPIMLLAASVSSSEDETPMVSCSLVELSLWFVGCCSIFLALFRQHIMLHSTLIFDFDILNTFRRFKAASDLQTRLIASELNCHVSTFHGSRHFKATNPLQVKNEFA